MFSYFYQLLKHEAIVLITFGTLRYSPSSYSSSSYYYYYIFIIITSSGDIRTTKYSRFKSMTMRIIMWTMKLLDAESCTA